MLEEGTKYRAETLRIIGLIFLTPVGRLFYDILYHGKDYEIFKLLVLIILSIILAFVGFILIDRGRVLLDQRSSIIMLKKEDLH